MFSSTTQLASFCVGCRDYFATDKKDKRTILEISILVLPNCIALYLGGVGGKGKNTLTLDHFSQKNPHGKRAEERLLCETVNPLARKKTPPLCIYTLDFVENIQRFINSLRLRNLLNISWL